MSILSCFPTGGSEILSFKNMLVQPSDWISSTYDSRYPYQATISTSGVKENFYPVVNFLPSDDAQYNFLDIAQTGLNSVTIYARSVPSSTIVIPNIVCYETDVTSGLNPTTLEETDWNTISIVSKMGEAQNYWSVGDTKSIRLQGTVGTLDLDTTFLVYIIGINHQDVPGITLQGFKTTGSTSVPVALVDSNYGYSTWDGQKYFNINHWGQDPRYGAMGTRNKGGWKGCDLRYDILGSTNIAPSGYGSPLESVDPRVGYDPINYDIVNSPVENTLMSCLPEDLRRVMRPMTLWTDNVAHTAGSVEENVTMSKDYLAFLSETEVFGKSTYANSYEIEKQQQYTFYSLIEPSPQHYVTYCYDDLSKRCSCWFRSPDPLTYKWFIHGPGTYGESDCDYSSGISPIFLV